MTALGNLIDFQENQWSTFSDLNKIVKIMFFFFQENYPTDWIGKRENNIKPNKSNNQVKI